MAGVSVIIPTRGGEYLAAAVQSAIDQTVSVSEIIVVVDGDEALVWDIRTRLSSKGPRVRVLASFGLGANGARQTGVRHANGAFVSFLDDDDLWLPDKIEHQLSTLEGMADVEDVLLTGRVEVFGRDGEMTEIWPARPIGGAERIDEYLFCRPRSGRANNLQTSGWTARREVFSRYPWDDTVSLHQDWDWLVRNGAAGKVRVIYSEHTVARYRAGQAGSLSASGRLAASMAWACDPAVPLSGRARANFLAFRVTRRAFELGDRSMTAKALISSFRFGMPSVVAICASVYRLARLAFRFRAKRA